MSDDRSSVNGTASAKTWLEKLTQAFSGDPKNRTELLDQLREAQSNQVLDPESLSIIEGAMQVSEMQVREIMIPRAQMECVELSQPPIEFIPQIIKTAHSRYPVIGENKDEVIGILLAKDLLSLALKDLQDTKDQFCLKDILRPATFVPESKRLIVLLNEFRTNRNHMAIVVDEYGGVSGLVTIEDVLEQIVGDIEDEHDVEEDYYIKQLNENNFIVKALTPIEDFNEHFQSQFSDKDYDTIGGIVMQNFGHLPKRSESVTIEGFEFQVLNADNRRIRLLRVTPV
ncbi:CBS domain-containing protein [Zooshikella marina]|uniref:Magnesium and cobalt efflux protein CorC n=1 Tax=Zooshikella ganghwensis TaxID=202772 RepID=A0A4P9VJ76_9GAMM|nr:transporter associated domain-containing protein [Zooshikella ganghwensis]MBU2708398.1 CBS domain-containing protein [Zooshikella ganghwensis]RDH42636.1 CBS domain-containing protein [Zooshikella ganghwensis]